MSFPYIFESNFELGSNADWDSQNAAVIDFPHFTELARFGMAPYKGAYCFRQVMAGTADDWLVEADLDSAATARCQTQFWLYFSNDFTATANDTINLFELKAAGTVEATFGFRVVAATDVINLGIGETAPTSWSAQPLERGRWHLIEIDALNDQGANDGTIDLYVTPDRSPFTASSVHATQVGSLDQGAITQGLLGVQGSLDTTTGTILIDEFKFDGDTGSPTRTQMDLDRWNPEIRMTKSGHAFVGPGVINNVTLVGNGAASQELRLWDTDRARFPATGASGGGFGAPRIELHTTGTSEIVDPASMPLRVNQGCYIELDDDVDSSALIQVSFASAWGSEANVVRYGLSRS